MELSSKNVRTKQLGHLGLVAATIRDLGIIEKIDARIDLDKSKGGIVSYGKRAAAMILNGLGFINSRLYMSQMFFHEKPVSAMLGAEVSAENLNDDCLGRCLDRIAEYGTTKLFSEIAFEIAKEQGLLSKSLHLDTTSLTLYGEYNEASPEHVGPAPSFGYSKANRPDLKQVVLSMVQMGPSHIPVWMEDLPGNSSDKTSFHETVRKMQAFYNDIEAAPDGLCFVVDSAFYNEAKLSELSNVRWITRVPATLSKSKEYCSRQSTDYIWQTTTDQRYKIVEITACNSEQRWILVHSEPAYQREYKTLCKRMNRRYDELDKQLWHLSNQVFGCEEDAKVELSNITKKLKYFDVIANIIAVPFYTTKGRPKADAEPSGFHYKISTTIVSNLDKVKVAMSNLGRFILSTNILDNNQISNEEILQQYKEQTHVEAGFKFIKNDTFELDNVFLKSQTRIGALMMVMTLCLLVYNFAQYKLRSYLKEHNDYLPNQLGKPVQNPTSQWIFAILASISVVEINQNGQWQWIVTNIHPLHQKIIAFFGYNAKKIYDIPSDLEPQHIQLNQKTWLEWCGM
jgi:transposase